MNIFVRVDALPNIGWGHFIRCTALAEHFIARGDKVFFLSGHLDDQLIAHLQQVGVNYLSLTVEDPFNWQNDAIQVMSICAELNISCDLLIVDHYKIDRQWHTAVKNSFKYLMVIDDLANRQYECDFLLDQNAFENTNERYLSLVPSRTKLLLGPRYVLLRPIFAKSNKVPSSATSKRILISLGGGDCTAILLKVMHACLEIHDPEVAMDLIIPSSCNRVEIKKFCTMHPRFHYHENVKNIAELMSKAILSIGAGGSTIWEKCYLGLPSLVITTAQNQEEGCQYLNQLGVIKLLGNANETSQSDITQGICDLLYDSAALVKMQQLGQSLIDGQGCNRVINHLRNLNA